MNDAETYQNARVAAARHEISLRVVVECLRLLQQRERIGRIPCIHLYRSRHERRIELNYALDDTRRGRHLAPRWRYNENREHNREKNTSSLELLVHVHVLRPPKGCATKRRRRRYPVAFRLTVAPLFKEIVPTVHP